MLDAIINDVDNFMSRGDEALEDVGNLHPLVGRQWVEAALETMAYPDTAPAMVKTCRRMRKKPQREGLGRSNSTRKIPLAAAPG